MERTRRKRRRRKRRRIRRQEAFGVRVRTSLPCYSRYVWYVKTHEDNFEMDTVARLGTTRPIRKITFASSTRITDNLFVAPAYNITPCKCAFTKLREPGFKDKRNIIKAAPCKIKKNT